MLTIATIAIAPVMAAAIYFTPYHLKPTSWLTAHDIRERIDQVGAKQTVRELAGDNGWDYVTGRIGEGRSDWLELAPRLSPGADGDVAETLRDSLGVALVHNAAGVLTILDTNSNSPFGVGGVCSTPLANNLEKPPIDFRARAVRAVEAVQAPSLTQVRNLCLQALRRGDSR